MDRLDEGLSVEELRRRLAAPTIDLPHDVRLWPAGHGRLAGYGRLWQETAVGTVDGFVDLKVHPAARGKGLEDEIIAWAAARLRQVGQATGHRPVLRAAARDDQAEQVALLERHGFARARSFLVLARALTEPIPAPVFPPGYQARPLVGPAEAAVMADLYNDAFVDNFNFHPSTVEHILYRLNDPASPPELNVVATAPDGRLVAFCLCYVSQAEIARTGRQEGWITILGTRRGYRRLGLGRAMLRTGLRGLQAAGLTTALLNVDADNPTGATRLYADAGFVLRHTSLAYVLDLGP